MNCQDTDFWQITSLVCVLPIPPLHSRKCNSHLGPRNQIAFVLWQSKYYTFSCLSYSRLYMLQLFFFCVPKLTVLKYFCVFFSSTHILAHAQSECMNRNAVNVHNQVVTDCFATLCGILHSWSERIKTGEPFLATKLLQVDNLSRAQQAAQKTNGVQKLFKLDISVSIFFIQHMQN